MRAAARFTRQHQTWRITSSGIRSWICHPIHPHVMLSAQLRLAFARGSGPRVLALIGQANAYRSRAISKRTQAPCHRWGEKTQVASIS